MLDDVETAERWLSSVHLLAWLGALVFGGVTAWFTYVDRLPPIVVSGLAGVGAVFLGALVATGIGKLIARYPRQLGLHVPFSKAVQLYFARTEGTTITDDVTRSRRTPEEKLQWTGNRLLGAEDGENRGVRVYARRRPATRWHLIDETELKRLSWKFGADDLFSTSRVEAEYNDAHVNRFDIYRCARHVRRQG